MKELYGWLPTVVSAGLLAMLYWFIQKAMTDLQGNVKQLAQEVHSLAKEVNEARVEQTRLSGRQDALSARVDNLDGSYKGVRREVDAAISAMQDKLDARTGD